MTRDYAPTRPLRLRRVSVLGSLSIVSSVVLAVLAFFTPSASAVGPVPLLACVGSSICSPEGPAIMAELAAQGGTAGSTLSASEAASFAGIQAGYGATATTSGSAIIAAGSAGGTSAAGPILTGAATALLGGGVAAWSGHIGSSGALATLPAPVAGPTFSYLFNSGGYAYSSGTFSAYSLDGSGDVSSVTWSSTAGSSSDGDYGCRVDAIYRASGSPMPTSLTALNSALTAGTAAQYTVRAYGFGNGNHCTGSAAHTFTPSSTGRGSISSAWVVVGLSVNTWNFLSGIVDTYTSYSSVTAGTSSTPARHIEQTVTCKNSSGGVTTIVNTSSAEVWSPGDMVTMAGIMCPTGTRLDSWQATVKTPGAADQTVGSQSVSHPASGCDFVGGTLCTARVTHRVTVGSSTSWETCHVAGGACATWWTDPARDTNYRCEYGAGASWVVVGIGVCSIYRRAFPADPTATPPEIDPAVPPTVDRNPSDCDMSWSDVLSGAIVYKAVSCALQWAFVPSPTTLTEVQTQVSTAWDGTAPAVIVGAVSDVSGPLRGLADASSTPDCLGPEVDWEWGYLDHAHPFATCSGLPQTMSDYFRPILGAVVLLGALGQAARTLAGTIGLQTPRTVA